MNTASNTFKKASSRTKKTAPVRRVALSDEAKKAYEELVIRRDERARTYEQHLATDRR